MKLARSTMVTATAGAAAALAVTGITYASAASAPAPQQAPVAAASAAPSAAPSGTTSGKGNEGQGKGNEGRRREEGRILINERSYSAHPGDCITVVSGLGAKTLNVRNDSHRRVEVFRGAVCDNGAPVATVGAHSSSFGVDHLHTKAIHVEDGVVASFRVICDDEDGRDGGRDGDNGGGDD
ncbi:hypothetical protein [Streptomyces alanosinicus]|uniref:Uncharacterized protein n=1 Tax=Streptomyces alanosinicus TaxID=68171 RepID=A0A919D581_9ACTN|nr:hypothetical protein [Streptomyces alanosinicus]GHE09027.1 hypothetical protein GCM10010339_59970 [Streptomyces alanosinicus]